MAAFKPFIMSSTDQRILVTWPVVQASIRDVRLRQQNTVRSLATLELIVSHADKPVCPWRLGGLDHRRRWKVMEIHHLGIQSFIHHGIIS